MQDQGCTPVSQESPRKTACKSAVLCCLTQLHLWVCWIGSIVRALCVAARGRRHGFWGIFLLAAWPNALFDLCGICCGHFLMPFWQFFGATLMGKAFVKVQGCRPPSSSPLLILL